MGPGFLDNLSIEVRDYAFPNGVVGKIAIYNMEERQRVKVVDFIGSKKVETSKIDDKLKEVNSQIRLDTFIDPGLVKKVENVVRDMMKEKGFQQATVTHTIEELAGQPKLVHLTFKMDEGPKVKIRKLVFDGNKQVSDPPQEADEGEQGTVVVFISGCGTYQETKPEDDAERRSSTTGITAISACGSESPRSSTWRNPGTARRAGSS